MHVRRRRLPNFEACSVALFASLAMGATTLPARAQSAAPGTRSLASTATAAPPGRTTLRLKPRLRAADPAVAEPDGSVSSLGFDESLK